MEITFAIMFGLVIGSFLNVCIYRIPKGESISFPPSHCCNCGKRIKWYDLFPVISFLLLKGKCRFCKDKISIRYSIIELTTGALFGALYIDFGLSFNFIKYAALVCFLIVIGMIDLDTTDVYDITALTGAAVGVFFTAYLFFNHMNYLDFVFGGLLAGGIIAVIILVTKGMGWGDAEICLLCGIFLGLKLTLVMLMLSFIIGGVTGIVLIISKLKTRKDYIPFGPFIALSTIITIFFGNNIIAWYINVFLH